MYEMYLTQKSLSNQAAFYWSMWQIHATNTVESTEQIHHISDHMDSSWEDWISQKYTMNVTSNCYLTLP